jgi:hypothetical protein
VWNGVCVCVYIYIYIISSAENLMTCGHFVFAFLKCFLKKFEIFLFFYLLQINIFLVFLNHFNILMSKIIFKK